jgi:hypothetical protein
MSYIEPKITALKWSFVQHGLERLAQFGVYARIWNRLRFDDKFTTAVSKMLAEMNQSMAGKQFRARFEKQYTRLELNEILCKENIMTLRHDIIQKLKPDDKKTDQPELIGTPHEREWFVVDPGYSMDEEAARIELNHRGLVPCNTEDGMSFIWAHRSSIPDTRRIIVLDSWRKRCGEKEFLTISRTMAGQSGLFLTEAKDLKYDSVSLFLGKRGEVTKEEDSED